MSLGVVMDNPLLQLVSVTLAPYTVTVPQYTVGTGANRSMAVGVVLHGASGRGVARIVSVTFSGPQCLCLVDRLLLTGIALTAGKTFSDVDAPAESLGLRLSWWYLLDPPQVNPCFHRHCLLTVSCRAATLWW